MDLPKIVNMPSSQQQQLPSHPKFAKEDWDAITSEINIPKESLNKIIMDYLITHGYQATAQRFMQEANVNTNVELSWLGERRNIMSLIQEGKVQLAIEKINDVNSELLDTNPALHFALLRLQLIELIRIGFESKDDNSIQPAIEFASNNLAVRAPSNPQFLEDLEKTMALLCFPPGTSENVAPQLQELMDIKLRKKIAQQVNTALMEEKGMSGEAKINNLTRLWGYGESLLEEHKVEYPYLQKSDLF